MQADSIFRAGRRPLLILSAVVLFVGLCGLALAHPTAAAPPNQTIVLPTPTPEVAVPTPTPVPDADADADNDDEREEADGETAAEPDDDAPTDIDGSLASEDDGDLQDGTRAGGSLSAADPGEAVDFFAVIKDERVSLYAEPSTSARVVGTALQGEQYQVVGRNRGVTWYVICCTDEGAPGWISTRSIVREFDLVDAVDLPVIEDLAGLDLEFDPVVVDDRPLGEIPVVELLAFTVAADRQELTVGSRVRFAYRIGNIGRHELTNVVVRNLVPAGLAVDEVLIENGTYTIDQSADTISLVWSTLSPGQVETATVDARVTPAAARRSVIEYLATLTTDEEVTTSAGALLGLPPSAIPDFR